MEGSDVFQYYHPQDLPYLKEVYEAVMTEQVWFFLFKKWKCLSTYTVLPLLRI